jgi:hypothetical protein
MQKMYYWVRRLQLDIIFWGLLLVLPFFLIFIVGVPVPFAPIPLVLVVPALLGAPAFIVVSIPALIFWAVGWSLFARRVRPGIGLLVFYGVLGVLNAVVLALSIRYSLRHHGVIHTLVVSGLSLTLFASGIGLAIWARRRPTFPRHLAAQWVLALWLAWYAFPYLGELP